MKSLQQILKENSQSPNQAYQAGKLEFDKTAGCKVYGPSRNNSKTKSFQAELLLLKNNGGS